MIAEMPSQSVLYSHAPSEQRPWLPRLPIPTVNSVWTTRRFTVSTIAYGPFGLQGHTARIAHVLEPRRSHAFTGIVFCVELVFHFDYRPSVQRARPSKHTITYFGMGTKPKSKRHNRLKGGLVTTSPVPPLASKRITEHMVQLSRG